MKRLRSVSPSPADRKRRRASSASLESFSDEIIIQILSYLDAGEVCQTELVNRRFASLSNDAVLWKQLYQRAFDTRRRSKSQKDKSLRQLGHVAPVDRVRSGVPNWKRRYHIRSNWVRGRCRSRRPLDIEHTMVPRPHTCEVRQGNLYIDSKLHPILSLKHIDHVHRVDSVDHLLLSSGQSLVLYNHAEYKLVHKVHLPRYKTILFHDSYMALLSCSNGLSIYHINTDITLLAFRQGLANADPVLNIRSMDKHIVVTLLSLEHGILDTVLSVQEFLLSMAIPQLVATRVAVSNPCPSLYSRQNSGLCQYTEPVEPDIRLSYHHPYILVSFNNYLHTLDISSTPEQLRLSSWTILWGYGSAIKSCHINKLFRLVVGTGNAGARLWNLTYSNGSGGYGLDDISLDSKEYFYPLGRIAHVDETSIVTLSENGDQIVLDFDI